MIKRSLLTLALFAPLLAAAPAPAAVVINEVQSDGKADFVELVNDAALPADISNYVIKDSKDGNQFTVPLGTSIPAHGYYVSYVERDAGFGLGENDAARLFAPGGGLLDSYAWGPHAVSTYGRCADASGPMTTTSSSTPGEANDCTPPATAVAWPGGSTVALADEIAVLGANVSGLAYEPSGTGAPGVLWAVRNGPSTLFRLLWDGKQWTPDSANGWANGKQLLYPDGSGVPDAEGVTLAGGDGVYVATERNDIPGLDDFSRPAVLRYDVTAPGAALTATKEFNFSVDVLPVLDANAGPEAITWIPDEVLVAKGFRDEATGAAYNPATYANHGTGLFFVGIEQDGKIVAYALNQSTGGFKRVAALRSGFPKVMELQYDAEIRQLWAVCDNTCGGRTATLDVAPNGRFAVTHTYERPAGMDNLNHEGFAIAPQAECVNGRKPVFWSDDTYLTSNALRAGTINCTAPRKDEPKPNVVPGPAPAPSVDRTAPALKVALKLVRRTGKLRADLTLNERADLAISATARKRGKAKARTLLKTTRKGVAAGQPSLTFALKRGALRKGETVTLTIQARDAAGNVTTRTAKARVR